MSSLGELYFQLGLDDKKFNDAIEAAKQKVKELGADVEIGVKLDFECLKKEIQAAVNAAGGGSFEIGANVKTDGLENMRSMLEASKKEAKELEEAIEKATTASVKVQKQSELDSVRKRISEQEAKILAKGGSFDTHKPAIVKVQLDEESINQVKARLVQLETPITPKISVEYDVDKFQAASTTLDNYTKRLNELGKIRLGIDDGFLRTGVSSSNGKGLNGWLNKVSDYLLGDDTGEAAKSIKSIQKILDSHTFKVKVDVDAAQLAASVKTSVKRVPIDVDVNAEEVKKKLKQLKVPLDFNVQDAIKAVKAELKRQEFKAKLSFTVTKKEINEVIQNAVNQSKSTSTTTKKASKSSTKKATGEMKDLGNATKDASNWASQLSNQFNNLVSIYSLERFIRNLYTIGGEFQKQQIALQNMIGDVNKGNAIFERMKGLAVKSPFTFSELSSYTKQMSAYGIEYENLYDTTKRLADISAGVGVDMGRLILAFGQVRSAAVLRGQELRQFTEAGIPLVAELAKKFTELEGRVVSTGEVFEKISKREVSFGMVKDILFDMTDPGGRFFETQEKLAESLAGKWSNLKDAWDIMVADIANGNNSVLSGLADIINSLIRGFETWLPFVSGAVVALGLLRGAITAVNIVSTANPWVLIGSVMAGVVSTVISLASETETATELITRLNRELESSVAQNNDNERNANRYLDILKKQADSESDKYALYQKQKAAFEELLKLYPKATEIAELELMTLEEIEKTRKRIAEQTKKDNLNQYDVSIDEAYNAYEKKRIATENILRDSGKTIDDFPETKKELEALYNLYTNAMNAKEMYEQSFIDAARPKPLADWQIKADEIIAKYPNIAALKRDKGDDIWVYFDFLEATFKEAKEKYDRVTSESMKKPYKAIMDAVNAVNMGIGGVSFYSSKKKGGKSNAEKAAEKEGERIAKAYYEGVKRGLSEVASKWDLYKQLFDATGNKEFAMTAFKVTPIWDEAAKEMADKFKQAALVDDVDWSMNDTEAKEKFGELFESWKLIKDRIEKNGIDLKVNIADIYKSSKDFDIRIDAINRELHDKLQNLSTSGLSQDVIGALSQDLTEQAEQAISEVEFEKFKKSVDYVRFFSNLENQGVNSILAMRDAMLKFGSSTELSTEEMDALVEDVERLEKSLVDKHPFKAIELSVGNIKALRDAYNSASNAYKKDPTTNNLRKKEQAKSDLDAETQRISIAFKRVYDRFSEFANAVGEISSMLEKFGNRSLTNFANFLDSASSGMQSGYNVGSFFGAKGGVIGGFIGAATGAMAGLVEAGRKAVDAEQERSQIVIDRLDKVASLLKDRIAESLTGLYNSTLDATSKMEMERKRAEYDEAAKKVQSQHGTINPNSWYGMTFDKTTFSWDTNDYLVYSKKTHDAINRALEMDNEFMATYASMLAQRDELMYQQATYTDKDSDKVDAYKRDKVIEIQNLNAEIEKLTKDILSSLYNVDFKDWASQLADSIVNAWANGEDAAKAYEATVSDILRNVATSMIQQKILGDYFANTIDPWVKDFIESGGVMTNELYYRLAGIVDGGMERIDQAEEALDAWEKVLNEKGLSLKDNKNDSSSGGLSKGIQSITEDTANLLGSYLNSVRADVSIQRTLIEQLVSVDVPQMSIIAQAQLQQLQQVVANTKRNADAADSIREALSSVIGIGKNGKAIKIV